MAIAASGHFGLCPLRQEAAFFCFFIFNKTTNNDSSLLSRWIAKFAQMGFESGGNMKENEPTADDVMSYKGLSAYLKLSQSSLRHKVMGGTIPSFRIDGAVRFSKKQIDEWLEGLQKKSKKKTTENNNDLFPVDGGNE